MVWILPLEQERLFMLPEMEWLLKQIIRFQVMETILKSIMDMATLHCMPI